MIVVTGDSAKRIYAEMRKMEFAPTEIYDYEIPSGIVAIDRYSGDCAIVKRAGQRYVAMKGTAREFLTADLEANVPEINIIKAGEINDLIVTARDVIYR